MSEAAAIPAVPSRPGRRNRGRLFRKYVALFVAVVCLALFANGLFEIWFSYQEHRTALIRIQREQAEAAAAKIGQFVKEIEGQLGWTVQLPWSASTLEQRRFDALRLLRQVPAITELSQLDSTGKEQLRVSRLAMDVVGSGTDFSNDPKFAETVARKVYYGPVYFRRESEPYMTLAVAGTRRDAGVSVAEVNLKLIWDVISQIKVGRHGHAYVVGSQGRLIAHPDISLVLRNTDMSRLPQVQAATAGADGQELREARDTQGRKVLTAHAQVSPLRWLVFVELPVEEAYAPLYDSIKRSAVLLLGALLLAALAGMLLARRMVVPIQALRAGAERIGAGDLTQRISVKTGDELETLADQFNDMAAKLQESYAGLERKVEERTQELSEALEQQTATSQVLQVINASPGDLAPVFEAMLAKATQLCRAKFGILWTYEGGAFTIAAERGTPLPSSVFGDKPVRPAPTTALGRIEHEKRVLHIRDLMEEEAYRAREPLRIASVEGLGMRSWLGVPLLKEGRLLGVFTIYRGEVRPFSDKEIALVTSFADQAVIAIENVRLFEEVQARTEELTESLQQQTATADVLKVISRSAFDLQTVLDTLVASAARLCGADKGVIFQRDGDVYRLAANFGFSQEAEAYAKENPLRPGRGSTTGRVALEGRTVHIPDVLADPEYVASGYQSNFGYRTNLGVPLLREGTPIGVFVLTREVVNPFTDKQIELVTTFADQAVIAIENVRLFEEVQARTRELQESLEYQTATSEVLNVISRSTTDVQPVFEAIVQSAAHLFAPWEATLTTREDDRLHWKATASLGRRPVEAMERARAIYPIAFDIERSPSARAIQERRIIEIPDAAAPDAPEYTRRAQRAGEFGSITYVPLLRDGDGIGTIILTHPEAGFKLSAKQLALVQTFADQAVIAIENARLFEEVQARTRELQESLEYQTATSEVLGVISRSPNELQPVLDAIVAIAARICQAHVGDIALVDDSMLRIAASIGDMARPSAPVPLDRGTVMGRSVLDGSPVHIEDLLAAGQEFPSGRQLALRLGFRTILAVPLLRGERALGTIVLRRESVQPFSDKQIALLKTFADQAVIAINNVGLFEEVQARTRELTESLEYQTATSDVLNVISRSPNDLQPVLDTIVETAYDLCQAQYALFFKLGPDGLYHLAASKDADATFLEWLRAHPIAVGDGTATGLATLEKQTVHLRDALTDPRFTALSVQQRSKARTQLAVPLMRAGVVIGVIFLARTEVKPFTERQVDLVTTFADQAVIAINNVGLFEEVQARTAELQESLEYQTATSEVLNVMSRSPTDAAPVFEEIVASAARLCGAVFSNVQLYDGEMLHVAATHNFTPEVLEPFHRLYPRRPDRFQIAGRAILSRAAVHVQDLLADPEYPHELARAGNWRAILSVPMLRDGNPVGVITVSKSEPVPFADRQIELLNTFADQAVIAINNVRLFEEVQARTRELTEALQQQTATADVLRVINNSLTDTQPVFDAIVQSGLKLFSGAAVSIALPDKDMVRAAAVAEADASRAEAWRRRFPFPLTREYMHSVAILDRKTVDIPDVEQAPIEFEAGKRNFLSSGYRAVTIMPMMRGDAAIGALSVVRSAAGPLSEKQLATLRTFASQAVIAIENTRLLNELRSRTQELARSVEELRALGEVTHAVNSTLDLETVLNTIVAKAVQLSATDAGAIYVFSNLRQKFRLRATYGMSDDLIEAIGKQKIGPGESYIGDATQRGEAVQVPDLAEEPPSPMQDIVVRAGYRALLVVPLMRPNHIFGALVVRRKAPGEFAKSTIDLLQTFAAQSVLAIQNARLFAEIEEKSREIEIASRHKSQFLANMSHELRTPMNAVLGFTEMMADGLYGPLPDKALKALERVQANGKHLLGLINDVLDLSKIEAGQLTLALDDYSVAQMVQTVMAGTESLAKAKGLALTSKVQDGLSIGHGDERRLTQVLLNLVGNAIKFTDSGSVEISARAVDGFFELAVHDTGPGIAPDDQKRIFEEFQQVDSSSTRKKGGTGLGLAISKRLVEMHGGTIEVDSVLGEGSTFRIMVPVRARERMEAA